MSKTQRSANAKEIDSPPWSLNTAKTISRHVYLLSGVYFENMCFDNIYFNSDTIFT